MQSLLMRFPRKVLLRDAHEGLTAIRAECGDRRSGAAVECRAHRQVLAIAAAKVSAYAPGR